MADPPPGADRYCSNCGERITRQVNYCHYCGERLRPEGDGPAGPGPDDAHEGAADHSREQREPAATGQGAGRDDAVGEDSTEWDDDRASWGEGQADRGGESQDRTNGGANAWAEQRRERRGATGRPPAGLDDDGGGPEDESAWRAVGKATGLGIAGIVLLVIVSVVIVLVSSPLGVSAGVLLIVGTAIGQYVGFGGVALGYLSNRGFTWEQMRSYLGVRVPTLRELAVVVAGYVAIVMLLIVVAGIASMFLPEPAENQAVDTTTENPGIVPFMILMMFLVVGPMEELLFRGIVQNRLRERFPAIPAIAIASAIFAAVHVVALAGSLTGMLVTVFILFFPATVFGAVYEYTGNLVVPALLHALHNSVIVGLILLAPEEAGSILALIALAGL
ncbi:CPBP family intramembrane metalloprotease domain-containing protein [Halobacteriales archaeon SW_10_66_29]|nr:MAG: CPBP family intramembrane metalloprotease domain-containing protein [Halobacteriales archaeon SW_10_66_29]